MGRETSTEGAKLGRSDPPDSQGLLWWLRQPARNPVLWIVLVFSGGFVLGMWLASIHT